MASPDNHTPEDRSHDVVDKALVDLAKITANKVNSCDVTAFISIKLVQWMDE
jgi:hypothetical protein